MSYKTMYKAAVKFAKNCHLDNAPSVPGGRVGIAGANYYHHPEDPDGALRQYITNGYYGASYSIPLPDLVEADRGCAIDYTRMLINPYGQYNEVNLPNLSELKEAWKKEKKRCVGNPDKRNKKWRLVTGSNGLSYVVVDVEYLIGLMEIIDCNGGEPVYYTNAVSPVFARQFVETPNGENCIVDGVLLPLRVFNNAKCLNDKPESKMTFLWGKTASDFVNQPCN